MSLIRNEVDELPVATEAAFTTGRGRQEEVAHFCEHSGISIEFTKASSRWTALATSAIKPWWLILKTIRSNTNDSNRNNKKKIKTEVLENA